MTAQQVSVRGVILDQNTNLPIPYATIFIKNSSVGTTADESGSFELQTSRESLPFTLTVFATQYLEKEFQITQNGLSVIIRLKKGEKFLADRKVSAAGRFSENLTESPVSVEKLDTRSLQHSPFFTAYESIERFREITLNSGSFNYKSPNARGFADFNNTRFLQLVDGIDNAPSGLNFNIGNVLGISELDMESIDFIPGAASALYGPNAFNGILFLNTRNPFEYQGLSVMAKGGLTDQEIIGSTAFTDLALRFAKAFGKSERVGLKINAAYFQGTDWWATDLSDRDTNPLNEGLSGQENPSYDGINVYGDEITRTIDVNRIISELTGQNFGFAPIYVGRTGYQEKDLVDYDSESIKLDGTLAVRLFKDLVLSGTYRYLRGNTIHQATNRLAFRDIVYQQAKVELRSPDFLLRAYQTQNDAGNSYDTRYLAWNLNRSWKSDINWFTDYTTGYISKLLGLNGQSQTNDLAEAHEFARSLADQGRLLPGTADFTGIRDSLRQVVGFGEGARLIERSKLRHAETYYNFRNLIPFTELQIGGNLRQYELNSEGTVFNDADGPISILEYGAYAQITQRLFKNDALKLSASVRYDKNQNFEGLITPRASAVISLGKEKAHNIRMSYQTGFRNPDALGQYLALDLGVLTSLGSAPDNIENFARETSYLDGNNNVQNTVISGAGIYSNSYTSASVQDFTNAFRVALAQGFSNEEALVNNVGRLEVADYQFVKPERVQTIEIGYKVFANRNFLLDISSYVNRYENLNQFVSVTHILGGDVNDTDNFSGASALLNGQTAQFQLTTISEDIIYSQGIGLSFNYVFWGQFSLAGAYQYTRVLMEEEIVGTGPAAINTPPHRVNVSLSNYKIGKTDLSFALNFRWLDEYDWISPFWSGTIPAHQVIDAQISYTFPEIKTTIRIGSNNILNEPYRNAAGAPAQGSVIYAALIFNNLR